MSDGSSDASVLEDLRAFREVAEAKAVFGGPRTISSGAVLLGKQGRCLSLGETAICSCANLCLIFWRNDEHREDWAASATARSGLGDHQGGLEEAQDFSASGLEANCQLDQQRAQMKRWNGFIPHPLLQWGEICWLAY